MRNGRTLQIEVTGETDTLTISGGLSVNSGTLVVKHANALGQGAVTVAEGATLEIAAGINATGFSSLSFADGANATINGTLVLGNEAVTLNSLTLGTGATLELNEHAGSLTTTTLTVGGNATLNADLVVVAGGEMHFTTAGTALTMGCNVTIGEENGSAVNVYIESDNVEGIRYGQTGALYFPILLSRTDA